jgi:hypothetical protein
MQGPATVVDHNGQLAMYDASLVRARLFDTQGREVPLHPRDQLPGLADRFAADNPGDWLDGAAILVAFSQVDTTNPRLEVKLY